MADEKIEDAATHQPTQFKRSPPPPSFTSKTACLKALAAAKKRDADKPE